MSAGNEEPRNILFGILLNLTNPARGFSRIAQSALQTTVKASMTEAMEIR